MFISVSLKNPATKDIVQEVNVHHHTKKACQKYNTKCRFQFPRFPVFKTIISSPSNIIYPDEKERRKKMKRYTQFLEGVKEVLEDVNIMSEVTTYKEAEIEQIFEERKLKWRLKQLILEAEHNKQDEWIMPDDLEEYLERFRDENGCVQIEELKADEEKLSYHEEEMNYLMEERIKKMLEFVNNEKIDPSAPSLMEEYLDALSVNKQGQHL